MGFQIDLLRFQSHFEHLRNTRQTTAPLQVDAGA